MPRTAGFTLIEVTVVLVILGLVGGLIVARGTPRSAELELRAATATVAQSLRAARAEAIRHNRPVAVEFGTAAGTLRVGTGPIRAIPGSVRLALVTTADRTGVDFLPDGSSSGGTVDLTAPGRHATIAVSWISGRVTVRPSSTPGE